jgi:hypothetical protein
VDTVAAWPNREVPLRNETPGKIDTYWVNIEGIHGPVKQALSIVLGVPRSDFQSYFARWHFEALGFTVGSG